MSRTSIDTYTLTRASGLLPDWLIRKCIKIEPFVEGEKRPGKISWGLGHYGYDIRLGNKFKLFSNIYHPGLVVDPKNISERSFQNIEPTKDETGRFVIIPPNSYILGESFEHFVIPRDIICLAIGKSTYARCGLICNLTPLEPEWTGHLTIEISNSSPLPAKIYAGEGICQILFFRTLSDCRISYADKAGIYQAQEGLVLPRVRGEEPKEK